MGKLINPDQTEFVKGHLASVNVRNLLGIMREAHKIPSSNGNPLIGLSGLTYREFLKNSL